MSTTRAIDLFAALSGIDEDIILETRPPVDAPAPVQRESRLSRFLSNGWVAAVLSAVTAIGLIVAIVLAGRGEGPGGLPAGTVEPESESLPARVETAPETAHDPTDPDTMHLPEGATLDSTVCIQQGKTRYLRICELTFLTAKHLAADRAVYIDLFDCITGTVYGQELFYGRVTVFSDRDSGTLGIVHFEGKRDDRNNAPVLRISCGFVGTDELINGAPTLLFSEMQTQEMTLLDFNDRGASDELTNACEQMYSQFIAEVSAWDTLCLEATTDPDYNDIIGKVLDPTSLPLSKLEMYLNICSPGWLWSWMFAEGNATTLSSLPIGTLSYATITAINSYEEILLTPTAHDGTQGRILVRILGVEASFDSSDVLERGVYQDLVDLTTGTRLPRGVFNGDTIVFYGGGDFYKIRITPWRPNDAQDVVTFQYYTSNVLDVGPEFEENTVEWSMEPISNAPRGSDYNWMPDRSTSVQIYREAFGQAANFLKKNDDAVMIVCTNENFAAYLAGREPTPALLRAYADACPPQAVWDSYFPPEGES